MDQVQYIFISFYIETQMMYQKNPHISMQNSGLICFIYLSSLFFLPSYL